MVDVFRVEMANEEGRGSGDDRRWVLLNYASLKSEAVFSAVKRELRKGAYFPRKSWSKKLQI